LTAFIVESIYKAPEAKFESEALRYWIAGGAPENADWK